MKSGFTLIETVLTLAVVSLLLAIALPRFTALKQGLQVEQAAQAIVAAHRRARIAAVLHNRPAILSVAERSLRITLVGAGQPHWAAPGPLEQGVAFLSPARDLTFSPMGVTIGLSNASFRLGLGPAVRTVVVSRLGRVRIERAP
jgi:prepilin-type N-terminal cleavage/methylation domain-containing protein